MHHTNQLRRWHQMHDRERMVWCAAFAQQTASPLKAAAQAELAVSRLQALDIDETLRAPEYDAARVNLDLTLEEFAPWYRVALLISSSGHRGASAQDIEQAYERFRQSRGDFY